MNAEFTADFFEEKLESAEMSSPILPASSLPAEQLL